MFLNLCSQYSDYHPELLDGVWNTLSESLIKNQVIESVSNGDKLLDPFRISQSLYTGPTPFTINLTDLDCLDQYEFRLNNEQDKPILVGGYMLMPDGIDTVELPKVRPYKSLLSEMLIYGFFCCKDDDFPSAVGAMKSCQMLLSMEDERDLSDIILTDDSSVGTSPISL